MSKETNNPMNDPEVRRMILSRLTEKERDELINLGETGSTSCRTWFKLNIVKNAVLAERFPKRYFIPSGKFSMN